VNVATDFTSVVPTERLVRAVGTTDVKSVVPTERLVRAVDTTDVKSAATFTITLREDALLFLHTFIWEGAKLSFIEFF
jgi:hypothetical protein